jgi:hypothetical protein
MDIPLWAQPLIWLLGGLLVGHVGYVLFAWWRDFLRVPR